MSDNKQEAREKSRNNARSFGAVVYVGGMLAATVLFISFVLTAFPENAYLSRVIMTMAGVAVGLSMLAFPVAMHNWVVTKEHRKVGTFLYYGELALISVNTIVAFTTLIAKNGGAAAPEWAILYEPFSVLSILYTVAAWGTLFLLDPQHKEFAADQQNNAELQEQTAKIKSDFLKTEEGMRLAAEMARAEILADWTVESHLKRKGLMRADGSLSVVNTPFDRKAAVSPSPLSNTDEPEK